jgi:hypothetical protein
MGQVMLLIHAKSYYQALNHARGQGLSYSKWAYVTADNIRGLREAEMLILPEAEGHEEHTEIMRYAGQQAFKIHKA